MVGNARKDLLVHLLTLSSNFANPLSKERTLACFISGGSARWVQHAGIIMAT